MTPNEYQEWAKGRLLNGVTSQPYYLALGLTGEAGEVADKIKKILRGDKPLDDDVRRAIALELGDTLWYLSNLALTMGYTLDEIMKMNVDKLMDRDRRGVRQGDGDNR